jgi:SET domain-containing protein
VDAVDVTKSNLARYHMNSQEDANVVWKKQRVGPQAGKMFFYTCRDVRAGEELCFNCGEQYTSNAKLSKRHGSSSLAADSTTNCCVKHGGGLRCKHTGGCDKSAAESATNVAA